MLIPHPVPVRPSGPASRVPARSARLRALLGTAVLAILGAGAAAPPAAVPENAAKAAIVQKICIFVTWPGPPPAGPFRIGILGPDPFGRILDDLVAGETIGGRPIQVKRAATSAGLGDCEVVYLSPEAREPPARSLADLRGRGILTLGETESFLAAGGMVRVVVTPERKIKLQINPDRVRAERLQMSAQLLRIAEIVQEDVP